MKRLIFSAILIALTFVLLFEAKADSGTYDEVAHITAGYTYLYLHDFRLYPDNPPFIKMLTVLPWLPFKNTIHFPLNSSRWNSSQNIDQWGLGREFLYQSGNDADQLIFLARLPVIFLTMALGILVYQIASNFYGPEAGLFALLLFAASPDIRAHGHLATTDVGATFFALLGIYLLYQNFQFSIFNFQSKIKTLNNKFPLIFLFLNFNLYLAGFIFGLALLSKYSMWFILLTLMIITISIILYLIVRYQATGKREYKTYSKTIAINLILFIITSFATIWIFSFLFNYNKMTFDYKSIPLNQSAASALSNNLGWKIFHVLPFPYYYRIGLETMYARNIMTQPVYLFGVVVPAGGWKLFFPVSYILKTPIPILLLLLFSLFHLTRLHFAKALHDALPLIIGLIFFSIITVIGNLSIGTRFYYPSTVLFIIFASSAYIKIKIKNNILFMLILFLWLLAENAYSFPFDISYVNELGGGTYNGYNALVDSSYDWGQDLKRFASWYKKTIPDEKIKMSYLGTADPAYYGIKYEPLTYENLATASGYIAISVTNLKLGGLYKKDIFGNTLYDASPLQKFKKENLAVRVGTTIFVFKF